ncbi:MAG: hypothetical protein QM571_02385 [Micrococcaceae bacterium]
MELGALERKREDAEQKLTSEDIKWITDSLNKAIRDVEKEIDEVKSNVK